MNTGIIMRKFPCTICRQILPLASFHKNSSQCRDCKREKDKGRRREGIRPLKEVCAAARARKLRWAKQNRNPLKEGARRAVRNAVEKKIITPSSACQKCGSSGTGRDGRRIIQGHHFMGYEHPLSVQWLCPKCHRAADSAMSRKKEVESETHRP